MTILWVNTLFAPQCSLTSNFTRNITILVMFIICHQMPPPSLAVMSTLSCMHVLLTATSSMRSPLQHVHAPNIHNGKAWRVCLEGEPSKATALPPSPLQSSILHCTLPVSLPSQLLYMMLGSSVCCAHTRLIARHLHSNYIINTHINMSSNYIVALV